MTKPVLPYLGMGSRLRASPYFDATRRYDCKAYTTYNHMYMPVYYESPEEDFWRLVNHVTLWDVAGERQIEITGPDAAHFVQLLTPRDISKCDVGQCKYVLLTTAEGGIVNDPVLLKLGENHFWVSIADSDVLLWAKGVAVYAGMDVTIRQPDVSPLQVQGPKSVDVMTAIFGNWVRDLRYFRFRELEHEGMPLVISRTGWSGERGYEIFLRDGAYGDKLWEMVMEAGKPHNIGPAGPSAIRRIEAAMLSYGTDMTVNENPFEIGLEWLVDLDQPADFIGKESLGQIKANGVSRGMAGVEIEGEPLAANERHWPIVDADGQRVGRVTSFVWSPRLEKNIGLAIVRKGLDAIGTRLNLSASWGERTTQVVKTPFYDPKKQLTKAS